MVKRGLFVGRFQPFHKGHLEAFENVLKKVDELIIVVGSAQYSHRIDNPFTAGERVTMIREALNEAKVDASRYLIIPIRDMHVHMLWVAEVVGFTPRFDVAYTNEPLTRRLLIESGFKVEPIPFQKREKYSSTVVRERILNNKNWEELVPKSVANFIKKIEGVERLQELTKSDKAPKNPSTNK
jgi:nicotinamide-nucleotide adenylyltransferase